MQKDDIMGKVFDSVLAKRLLTYILPFKGYLLLSLIALLVTTLAELAQPALLMRAIDVNIAGKDVNGLIVTSALFVATIAVGAAGYYLYTYLTQWLGQKMMLSIRMQIFEHLQRLPLPFMDKNPVGRLVTRVTNDVESLNEMLSSGIVAILGDIVVLSGIIIILLSMNVKLALITFSVIPLIVLISAYFRKRMRTAYRDERLRLARINSFLQENITGMPTVQAYNMEQEKFQQFSALNALHRKAQLATIVNSSLFFPALLLTMEISAALIIWYGGGQIIQSALSLGALVAFLRYSRRFFQPIQDLAEKYNSLQSAMASSERIFKILDEPEQQSFWEPKQKLPGKAGKIEFRHVSHSYNGTDYVLRDLNFTIEPGEKVAIVGATGAGKTSILSLINRLYEPTKGQILLDGVDTSHIPLDELRSRIGIVLQDVFIFSGKVRDNISLGDERITEQAIVDAAKRVNAHQFITQFENGYDHILTERGSNISVGQKQLLSFARALAYDAEILILDEATSSVDSETEQLISKAIHELMQGRTSIIIAHRLSTIKDADRIIVMHKGKIRELGTHEELLANQSIYHRLYQLQFASADK